MADILCLIFGGRKAREAYRAYTDAIRKRTKARRELREATYGR